MLALLISVALIVLTSILFTLNYSYESLSRQQTQRDLLVGKNTLKRILDTKWEGLKLAATMLSNDFAFKEAVGTGDYQTIYTALKNSKNRIKSHRTLLISLEGNVLCDVEDPSSKDQDFLHDNLLNTAEDEGSSSGLIQTPNGLVQYVLVPLKAPITMAWVALGFKIDQSDLQQYSKLVDLELALVTDNKIQEDFTTFSNRELKTLLKVKLEKNGFTHTSIQSVSYEVFALNPTESSENQVFLFATKDVQDSLLAHPGNRAFLILVFILGLMLFMGCSFLISSSIIHPINVLREQTAKVAQGNWDAKIGSTAYDEISHLAESFNSMVDQLEEKHQENQKVIVNMEHLNQKLEVTNSKMETKLFETSLLLDISNSINNSDDYDEVLGQMLEKLIRSFNFDRGSIMRFDKDSNALKLRVVKRVVGAQRKIVSVEPSGQILLHKGQGIAGKVVETGKCSLLMSKEEKDYKPYGNWRDDTIESLTCVPVCHQEEVIGIINLIQESGRTSLNKDHLDFLNTVANHISLVLQNTELNEEAITDGMTKLYNKKHFIFRLKKEIQNSIEDNEPFSLILFDIDHFKKFNDSYGHLLGDKVLIEVAELFQKVGRTTDLRARYGGEEFVMILPRATNKEALDIAEELRKAIENHDLESEKGLLKVTTSLGVAEFPKDASTADELIKAADDALYKAKGEGRNNTQIYSSDENENVVKFKKSS